MSRGLAIALRLAVGMAALALLLWKLDLNRAWATLKAADRGWLLAAFGAQWCSKLCWCLRWRALLVTAGYAPKPLQLLRFILMGLFFNNFLPTTVGGDVARGIALSRTKVPKAVAAASVIADRILGLLALGLLAVIGGILGALLFPDGGPWLASIGLAAALLALVMALTRPELLERLRGLLARRGQKLAERLSRVIDGVSFLASRTQALGAALFFSLGLAAFAAVFHWAIARSIGIEVPLIAYFVIVPAVMLAASLPITLNGLGLRELGFVAFLGAQGVPAATAAVFALLAFLGPLVFAILGGILFVSGESRPRADQVGS
jgi:hypothetical protein